ncbi:MAG: oligosaccharide repeat unit polymerase [Lutibacter sp.]|nr:oligosaccharide repeat unit polymerase [Lutibacter sp.]
MFLIPVLIFTFFIVINRYLITIKKSEYSFFITPEFQLLILSTFYLIIPSFLFNSELPKLIDFNQIVIDKLQFNSLYYHLVFLINFILTKRNNPLNLSFQINLKKNFNYFILIFLALSSGVILIEILYNLYKTNFSVFSQDRVSKYLFYIQTKKYIGFVLFSWIIIIWSFVLGFVQKKIWPLVFQFPLVLLELICSSRYYIFILIISYLLLHYRRTNTELKLKYVFLLFLYFILFSFIRDANGEVGDNFFLTLASSFGEFINTYNSAGLVYDVNFISKLRLIPYVLQFFIPQPIFVLFFGAYYNVNDYITSMHNFDFGMGSSILVEGYSFGFIFNFIFPILICLVYRMLSFNLSKNTFIIYFLFSISIFSIFRGAFLINIGPNFLIYIIVYLLPSLFIFKHSKKIS